MNRRDPVYWQRLRKDGRSNVAAGLAAVAALTGTVSVITAAISASQFQTRADPLYWALMLPMAWWVSGLSTFAPRYIRSWKWVVALACLGSGASLAVAARGQGDWTIWAVGFVITVSAAVVSLVVYRDSLLAREGPAR